MRSSARHLTRLIVSRAEGQLATAVVVKFPCTRALLTVDHLARLAAREGRPVAGDGMPLLRGGGGELGEGGEAGVGGAVGD
mgnify:CR=1 FL=1